MAVDGFVLEAQPKTVVIPEWVVSPTLNKKRILLLGLHYPMAILSYFRHVLEKRPDVELVTAGVFTNDWIPWRGGIRLDMKYVKKVDLPLPQSITNPSWEMIKTGLQNNGISTNFDLILNVDAGFHLSTKPDAPYTLIATDPHVLSDWYDNVRPIVDYFFNMQYYYAKENDIVLPYCCSPDHHYAMSDIEKEYDASLIGLAYENRIKLVEALRHKGYKVLFDLGIVFDEYRIENNKAFIGLNWSSLFDINARTFEMMAMKQVPVINRLPHIDKLGFEEGRHYLGFDDIKEAVVQVDWVMGNKEHAKAIALSAHNLVHEKHTYGKRIQAIFDTVGL